MLSTTVGVRVLNVASENQIRLACAALPNSRHTGQERAYALGSRFCPSVIKALEHERWAPAGCPLVSSSNGSHTLAEGSTLRSTFSRCDRNAPRIELPGR